MAKRYSLNQIKTIQNRKIFFDANILIYLFWPSGQYKWEKTYSKLLSLLLKQQNKLYIDFLVISEVINRSHRIEYEKYLLYINSDRKQLSYKNFRNSAEGQEALHDINIIIQETILTTFHIIEKAFSKIEIQNFLTVEPLDFTDKAILKICIENDYVLCTNDRDFQKSNIDILSSNPIFTKETN